MGRSGELENLNSYYDRESSQILVLYGQKHLGIDGLLKEFCADKEYHYYLARPCSEREQQYQWGQQLSEQGIRLSGYPSYGDAFEALAGQNPRKLVLIIDEFSHMVKNGSGFMDDLVHFVRSRGEDHPMLVLLVSSAVGWVENSMINRIGQTAYSLSGLLKVRELTFYEMARYFDQYTLEQCIETYAILGGYPALWEQFDRGLSVRENVIQKILPQETYLHAEAARMVEENLRETSVYNTLLTAIASGRNKLNDLYEHTGFSRAKISVYLKNLMELELVEKVFSYETDGRENAQKGIYRISNHLVHFYFTFLYCHMSDLKCLAPDEFYKTYIAPGLRRYVEQYFRKICVQNLQMRNDYGQLPFTFDRCGEWVGKVGNIDLIAQNSEGKTLVCLCNWEKPMMTYEDYEWLLFCLQKAKISADHIYLFSGRTFDEKLNVEAKIKHSLKLVPASEL